MSKKEKLIERLLTIPRDFTYYEACRLLTNLGYIEDVKGKTSGSRIAFYHKTTKRVFLLHKPHPDSYLKMYVVRELIKFLKESGEI